MAWLKLSVATPLHESIYRSGTPFTLRSVSQPLPPELSLKQFPWFERQSHRKFVTCSPAAIPFFSTHISPTTEQRFGHPLFALIVQTGSVFTSPNVRSSTLKRVDRLSPRFRVQYTAVQRLLSVHCHGFRIFKVALRPHFLIVQSFRFSLLDISLFLAVSVKKVWSHLSDLESVKQYLNDFAHYTKRKNDFKLR